MRIVSGKFRGKHIIAPLSLNVRPTTDYAKTALFNILNNTINFYQTSFLDLCAGTGNISYEFYSRGCDKIVAVDDSKECNNFIKATIKKLNAGQSITIIKSDIFLYLENCNQKFDVIFADPPYENHVELRILKILEERKLLNRNGVFIYEHSSERSLEGMHHSIITRKYGLVSFSFFKFD